MTEPTSPSSDRVKAASERPRPGSKRGHAARGGRIVVAGLAAGAGLGLVGAMSAAARSSMQSATVEPVRRVIVVDRTTGSATSPADSAGTAATGPASAPAPASGAAAVAAEPAPLPLPPLPDPRPAPPVTQSEGS